MTQAEQLCSFLSFGGKPFSALSISGVIGGVQGYKRTPKVLFGENPGKISGKIPRNLGKICENLNLHKIPETLG